MLLEEKTICEQFVNIEIEASDICNPVAQNVIGAEEYKNDPTLGTKLFVGSDLDTIYVDSENGDDLNSGELASPVKTLDYALNLCKTSGFENVEIINDTTPYEFHPDLMLSNNYLVQSSEGVNPQVTLGSNVIQYDFSEAVPVGTFDGHISVQGADINNGVDPRVYLVNGSDKLWHYNGTTTTLLSTLATCKYVKMWTGVQNLKTYDSNNNKLLYSIDVEVFYALGVFADTIAIYKGVKDGGYSPAFGPSGALIEKPVITTSNGYIVTPSTTQGIIDFCAYHVGMSIETMPATNIQQTHFIFFIQQISDVNTLYGGIIGVHSGAAIPPNPIITPFDIGSNPCCLEQFRNQVFIGTAKGVYKLSKDLNDLSGIYMTTNFSNSDFILESADLSDTTALRSFYYNNKLPLSENDRLYAGKKNGDLFEYNPNTSRWKRILNVGVEISKIEILRYEGIYNCMYLLAVDGRLIRVDLENLTYQILSSEYTPPPYLSDDITVCFYYPQEPFHGIYRANLNSGLKHNESFDIKYQTKWNGITFKPPDDRNHSGFRICHDLADYESEFQWCSFENLDNILYWHNPNVSTHLDHNYVRFNNCDINSKYFGLYFIGSTGYQSSFYTDIHENNIYNPKYLAIFGYMIDETPLDGIYNNNFYNAQKGIQTYSESADELSVHDNIFFYNHIVGTESLNEPCSIWNNIFYNNNTDFINCTTTLATPNIFKHPLFISIIEGLEDFHVHAQCEGGLFTSPAVQSPRDIGAYDIERNALTQTNAEVLINYQPRTLTITGSKSSEELLTNFLGQSKLISRPIHLHTLKFDYDDSNYQGHTDPYKVLYVYSLQSRAFRLWFDGLKGTGKIDYQNAHNINVSDGYTQTLRSDYLSGMPIDDMKMLFPYLEDQQYNLEDTYIIVYHNYNTSEYKWQTNQWKGFYVDIWDSNNDVFLCSEKIIYNGINFFVIQFEPSYVVSMTELSFQITYFRGGLKTTQQEIKKLYLHYEPLTDEKFPQYSSLEFIEL